MYNIQGVQVSQAIRNPDRLVVVGLQKKEARIRKIQHTNNLRFGSDVRRKFRTFPARLRGDTSAGKVTGLST